MLVGIFTGLSVSCVGDVPVCALLRIVSSYLDRVTHSVTSW